MGNKKYCTFFCINVISVKKSGGKKIRWIFARTQIQIVFSMENSLFGFEEEKNDALTCIILLSSINYFWNK